MFNRNKCENGYIGLFIEEVGLKNFLSSQYLKFHCGWRIAYWFLLVFFVFVQSGGLYMFMMHQGSTSLFSISDKFFQLCEEKNEFRIRFES